MGAGGTGPPAPFRSPAAVTDAAPFCGVIFAATGQGYRRLAARAAATVRQHCPGLPIDLYTDVAEAGDTFDRVEVLADPWHRSKIDAMAMSRFDRTLLLDADLVLLADIRDVFELLDRFEIALAHDPNRNKPTAMRFWRRPVPAAFPQFNSGVVAYRGSERVRAFLREWARVVREENMRRDQPALRELLWESDLRIATLPEEYNLVNVGALRGWKLSQAAPRIIHHYRLHEGFSKGRREVTTLADLVGPMTAARLPLMLAGDRALAARAGRAPRAPSAGDRGRAWFRGALGIVPFWGRRAGASLRTLLRRP
jgi:hypothetical protein